MKRGWIGALGVGTAGALLCLGWAFDTAAAQETRPERRVVAGPAVTVLRGSGGYLGVAITDVDESRADEAGLSGEYGVYVSSVTEDGPASEAGIREGDVLVSWNGERLNSVVQLQRLTGETPPGRTVRLGVVRDGSEREIAVELGDRSEAGPQVNVFTVPRGRVELSPEQREEMQERASEMRERARELQDRIRERVVVSPRVGANLRMLGRPRLGVSIQSMSDQLGEYFGVDGGALVTDVSEDSPAAKAGIRAGDVIVAIAGEEVEDPGDLLEALSDREAGPVDVTVVRDGSRRTLTVELEEADAEGGVWRFDDDGEGVFTFGDEGGEVRFAPFDFQDMEFGPLHLEGFELEPMSFEGLDLEPFEWRFEWDGDAEPIEISIPRIRIPDFEIPAMELPAIDVPRFNVRVPRMGIVI